MTAGEDIRELAETLVTTVRADIHKGRAILDRMQSIVPSSDPAMQAFCLRAHGNILQVEGKLSEAVAEYRQALARFQESGEQVEAARTASSLVGALAPLGEYDEALRLAGYARQIFSEAGLALRLARLDVNVGNIFHRLGKLEEALKFYESAAATLIASGDNEAAGAVLINSAVLLMLLYRFGEALDTFERATAFCTSRGMHALTTQSEYNRGYLLYLIGRSLDALRVLQAVEKEFENQLDEFNLAQSRLDRADVLIELNLPEHAAGLAAAAEAAFSRLGASSDRARALLISGRCAFKQNDLRRAEASFEQARSIFHAEGNKVWACLADFERAGVLLAARNVDVAWSVAVQAAEALPPAEHRVFAVQAQLVQARIRIAQDKPAEALQLVRDLQGATLPAWLEYQLEYLKGRALELCGDGEVAIASYKRAVELLEFLGANVFLDDVMLRLSADKPDAYLRLVELTKDPARAFDYLERFRSHMLPRIAGLSDDTGVTPAVRDIRQALRMSYLELLQKPSMPDARVIDRIRQQEQQLMERVREYRIAHQEPSVMQSQQVPRNAEEEPAIVEYLVDGGRVQAFVVQAGRVQRYRLGISAGDVELKVAFVHHYMHSSDPAGRSGLDRHLAELYEELMGEFEEILGTDVVVVPDGCLRDLPFHALGSPSETVLDRHTISYAPSAESYRAADRRSRHPENASILVGVDLPDIPSVQEEIRAAAVYLPNPVVCNRPDVAGLPEAFSRAAFVHIASHGFFRKDDPSFSMLLLGSDVLTPSDIGTLRMEAELVTMSACSTSRLLAPDVQGFLRAFLILGVPSLVGSLWDVDDRSTAELMKRFYSNLRQGPDIAVALRQAMLEMRAQNDHPRYWAPFMLVGRRRLRDSWKFLQNQCTDSRYGRDLLEG